jgi:hypothetical protein
MSDRPRTRVATSRTIVLASFAVTSFLAACTSAPAAVDASVGQIDSKVEDSRATDAAVRKRVFVTAKTYFGDLQYLGNGSSGLDGADRLCNSSAQAAGLPGTFQAWLSGTDIDAIDRITGTGPWYLTDSLLGSGPLAFASRSSLATMPAVSVSRDETGSLVGLPWTVWTGTLTGGTKFAERVCQQFGSTGPAWHTSAADLSSLGSVGDPTDIAGWTYSAGYTCDQQHHLYCFEQ